MFLANMLKKKEQQQQQQPPPVLPPPQSPQQPPPQQSASQILSQPPPQKSMFKGNIKVKVPPQQEQAIQSPLKTNSDILQPESDAYKQQFNQVETPTPQEEANVEQKVEVKINVEEVKKKPTGFGFLKKKQAEAPVVTDEVVQEQVESQIIYGVQNQEIPKIEQQPEEQEKEEFSPYQQFQQPQQQELPYQQELPQQQPLYVEPQEEQPKWQQQQPVWKNKSVIKDSNTQLDNSYVKKHQAVTEELDYFLKEANKKKAEIFASQQQIEKRIVLYSQKLADFNSQLTQLSIEQQISIQQEQFERAEEIEQQLKQIQERIQQIELQIKQEEKQFCQLQDEKENIRGEEYPFFQEIEQKLEEIERLHVRYTDEYKFEGSSTIKKLQQYIEEENERVKIQQIHTEIDSKHLDEEEQHLNQIMDNQTKEYRNDYDSLAGKKQSLEQEIIDLQQLLNQKKNELSRVSLDLISAREKIQQVQQKFNQQLIKVQNKRTKLSDELSSLALERAQIENLESDCLRKQSEYKNKLQQLADSLDSIKKKRNDLTKKANLVPEQCQQEVDVTFKYQEAKKASLEGLRELSTVQRQIDELNYKRNMGQSQLHEILNKKSELQKKLPKMIDDKAQLVQNKNFKGAAQINEQIKEAQRQISAYEEKISENQNQETQILKEIDIIEDDLIAKQQIYQKLNQNTEICRYYVLELKLAEIQQIEYFDMSELIQEVKNELAYLYNKYQEQIASNRQTSTDIIENQIEQQIENPPVEQLQEIDTQEVHQSPEEVHQSPEKEEEEEEEPVQELTEEEKQTQIQMRILLCTQLQEQIKQFEEQVQDYASQELYEEADQVQQQIDTLTAQIDVMKQQTKEQFDVDI